MGCLGDNLRWSSSDELLLEIENTMARITSFTELESGTAKAHSTVDCGYKILTSPTGGLLQLDTYGSADRQFEGKVSQSIQLEEEAAKELLHILLRSFPSLRREI